MSYHIIPEATSELTYAIVGGSLLSRHSCAGDGKPEAMLPFGKYRNPITSVSGGVKRGEKERNLLVHPLSWEPLEGDGWKEEKEKGDGLLLFLCLLNY